MDRMRDETDAIEGAPNTIEPAMGNTPQFESNWTRSDISSLLPENAPLRRLPRAWERKPHSPFARRNQGGSKVWRRVSMPSFTNPRRASLNDFAPDSGDCLAHSQRAGTIMSPKKAVKKRCVNNGFGQDWKVTDWERGRGSVMHKKAIQPPIVLRSGTIIDRDFDENEDLAQAEGSDEEEVVNETPLEHAEDSTARDPDNEWSDIESEEEADQQIENDTSAEAEVPDMSQCHGQEPDAREDDVLQQAERNQSGTPHLETAVANDTEVSPTTKKSPRPAAAKPLEEATHECGLEMIDAMNEDEHPLTHEHEVQPDDLGAQNDLVNRMDSPVEKDDTEQTSDNANPSPPSPISRSNSAPVEKTSGMEKPSRPRISDDTAILHAFLNRAAANKKAPSLSKRESLSNRRDSDTVRQALASPAKTDVLAELDPNSPMQRKEQSGAESPTKSIDTTTPAGDVQDSEAIEDEKPTRKSSRSKAKPTRLIYQMTNDLSSRGPNRITIRGSGEHLPIKRTEVQELSALTRSNTRKNKGEAIMPLARLLDLAELHQGEVDDQPAQKEQADSTVDRGRGKNVQWDQTLVYFQEHPTEPGAVEAEAITVPVLAGDIADEQQPISTEAAPSSPNKVPTKQDLKSSLRASAPPIAADPSEDDATGAEPTVNATEETATTKPKPAPLRRRSRIATPAKGLRNAAAFNTAADDIAAEKSLAQQKPTRAIGRAATPAKGLLSKCEQDDQPNENAMKPKRAAAQEASKSIEQQVMGGTQSLKRTSETPKPLTARSALPARKLNFGSSATATNGTASDAQATAVTGLTTPKKKAPLLPMNGASKLEPPPFTSSLSATVAKDRDDGLPGLASPAKKRRATPNMGSTAGRAKAKAADEEDTMTIPGLSSPAKRRRPARVE